MIRDSIAHDRQSIFRAAIVENIDRREYGIVEGALAVELTVQETGSATEAAARLGKFKGWVAASPRAAQPHARAAREASRQASLARAMPTRWRRFHSPNSSTHGGQREKQSEPTGGGESELVTYSGSFSGVLGEGCGCCFEISAVSR